MRKDIIAVGVLTFFTMALLVSNVFSYKQKNEYETKYKKVVTENKSLKEDKEKLEAQIKAKSNQNEEEVKFDTEEFLNAFFNWDSSKGERGWTKIKPFTTEKARGIIAPTVGDESSLEPSLPEQTIVSKLDKSMLYYTPVDDMNSNVFVRVWYSTTINGTTSESQMLLDLQMIYDSNLDRWIVNDVKIQRELDDEGYMR